MNELEFRAQIVHQFRRPGTSRLPGHFKRLRADPSKER
jgi:hypothetical protein